MPNIPVQLIHQMVMHSGVGELYVAHDNLGYVIESGNKNITIHFKGRNIQVIQPVVLGDQPDTITDPGPTLVGWITPEEVAKTVMEVQTSENHQIQEAMANHTPLGTSESMGRPEVLGTFTWSAKPLEEGEEVAESPSASREGIGFAQTFHQVDIVALKTAVDFAMQATGNRIVMLSVMRYQRLSAGVRLSLQFRKQYQGAGGRAGEADGYVEALPPPDMNIGPRPASHMVHHVMHGIAELAFVLRAAANDEAATNTEELMELSKKMEEFTIPLVTLLKEGYEKLLKLEGQ